jgi:hypothetical protein
MAAAACHGSTGVANSKCSPLVVLVPPVPLVAERQNISNRVLPAKQRGLSCLHWH